MLFQHYEKAPPLSKHGSGTVMSSATIQPHHLIRPTRGTQATATNKQMAKATFLTLCFLTIAAISATDIWFAVENPSIMAMEKNPICLALMQFDPTGFSFFILGKSLGTAMVILTLTTLYRRNYKYAMTVIMAVTCFQLGLLLYLTLSDPRMHGLPNFALLFSDTPESIWRIRIEN